MIRDELIEKKRKALNLFAERLTSSPTGRYIARIVLFGSLLNREVREDSDVDVIVLAVDKLAEVEESASDCAFEIGLETGESVEPLVYYTGELRHPGSYFLHTNFRNGEEIYSMNEEKMKIEESRGYLDLAQEYLEGARHSLEGDYPRLAVDAAYNAAELCAKGLLLLKLDKLPTSHGGIAVKFGESYIKDGPLPKSLGRAISKSFALRNRSRYDRNAVIGEKEGEEVLKLAEDMIKILNEELYNRGGRID